MFKHCFSFKGRIRRLEYGLSLIIIYIYVCIIFFGTAAASSFAFLLDTWLIHILFIPAQWFIISQSTRRCHDLGINGWWQLIPFYVFVMLFADGNLGRNKYGENPKGEGNFFMLSIERKQDYRSKQI